MNHFYTWAGILVIVLASVVGDVLLARAMKQVGDVHALWRRSGLFTVVGRVLGNPNFFLGVAAMAVAFFGNAFAAKIFLHEKVDRRRWIAAMLVAGGVALLAG
jgi:drug/metabolite transporter (DMT)-like permease